MEIVSALSIAAFSLVLYFHNELAMDNVTIANMSLRYVCEIPAKGGFLVLLDLPTGMNQQRALYYKGEFNYAKAYKITKVFADEAGDPNDLYYKTNKRTYFRIPSANPMDSTFIDEFWRVKYPMKCIDRFEDNDQAQTYQTVFKALKSIKSLRLQDLENKR